MHGIRTLDDSGLTKMHCIAMKRGCTAVVQMLRAERERRRLIAQLRTRGEFGNHLADIAEGKAA